MDNNIIKKSKNIKEKESLVSVLKLADRTVYSVPFEIVGFTTGKSAYLNGERIIGTKQYGYGVTEQKFNLGIEQLKSLIEVCNRAIKEIEAEQAKNN